jgi:sigma-B regulation protein RsbU (phosphoserine phosphatase)
MQCNQNDIKQFEIAKFCTKCGTQIAGELGDLSYSCNGKGTDIKDCCKEAIKHERFENEQRIALEIQEKLLPIKMPKIPGFEIASSCLSCQKVACDYFDFLEFENGNFGIALGDVSPKGISAAFLTAKLQASLHGFAKKSDEVASTIFQINNLFVRLTDTTTFAKFFYGVLDPGMSTLTFSNAGHYAPLLFRTGGKFERLETRGLIIGFLPNQEYEQRTVTIRPGEVIILCTDGIIETETPTSNCNANKPFGEEGLIEVIQSRLDKNATEIQIEILQAIATYTDYSPQRDDIAFVIIKRNKQR